MRNRHLLAVLFLIAITSLIYYDSFNNGFIWDDWFFVVNNKAIRNADIPRLASYFTDKRTSSDSEKLSRHVYRPLATASFALDHRLWGTDPRFYHAENAILHLMNAGLVYLLLVVISGSAVVGLAASLIFAVHPVQTEAVTWISGRSNMLFLLFYLAAFVIHVKRARPSSGNGFGAPLVLFTLSLLSKEMAITLPLVMCLYDLMVLRRKGLKGYLSYYLPFLAVGASYIVVRLSVLGRIAQVEGYFGGTLNENVLTTLKVIAGYIRLLILPVNLRLDYVVDISKSLFEPDMLFALAALTTVAFVYLAIRRNRVASFFLAWIFVTLIPVYNIIPVNAVMAERFLYLPSVGFAALVALLLIKFYRILPKAAAIIFGALILSYGAGTIERNVDWRNEIYLYTKDLEKSPGSYRFHYNLGYAYLRDELWREDKALSPEEENIYFALAEREFRKAIEVRPDYVDAYLNLGNIYNARGQYDKAIGCFNAILKIEENPAAYNNLGLSFYHKGFYDDAIRCYKKALSLPRCDQELVYENLKDAYSKKGR